MPRVVLVTGVSRDLGARFARSLAAEGSYEVIGVDVLPPRHDLGAVSFVRADIRNPIIAKVISSRSVDTVVHMAMVVTAGSAGGRSAMKEINVIGTMQLLAACQKAETFEKLVVQSSVAVYGASPRDPAKFAEEMSPRVQPRTGFGKDSIEIETYVRGLARRRPDVAVSTLRLANLMGAGVDSHVTRYLSLPVVPRVMGFDARFQFLHPTDAVEALLWVTREDAPGTYNVAASDIVTLTQAIRMMGRPSIGVPHFAAPSVAGLIRQARLGDFSSDQVDALTYGRAMATDRFTAATAEIDGVGFRPKYTSREALQEFVGVSRPGLLDPDRVVAALDRIDATLSVRRSAGAGHG
jgi:UDP-glucose 4-epimerase